MRHISIGNGNKGGKREYLKTLYILYNLYILYTGGRATRSTSSW
jgi:hypothetical protein